jgi:hypothetical protein
MAARTRGTRLFARTSRAIRKYHSVAFPRPSAPDALLRILALRPMAADVGCLWDAGWTCVLRNIPKRFTTTRRNLSGYRNSIVIQCIHGSTVERRRTWTLLRKINIHDTRRLAGAVGVSNGCSRSTIGGRCGGSSFV